MWPSGLSYDLFMLLGLVIFKSRCTGKAIRIWTDNDGGLGALVAGGAKAPDHNKMVHAVWTLAADCDMGIFVSRVSTRDNVSDYPSRDSYSLMHELGAVMRKPEIPCDLFWFNDVVSPC